MESICVFCCEACWDNTSSCDIDHAHLTKQLKQFSEVLQRFSNYYVQNDAILINDDSLQQLDWSEELFSCRKCLPIINTFCENYHQLKCLELKLQFGLERLVDIMKTAKGPQSKIKLDPIPDQDNELIMTSNGPASAIRNFPIFNSFREKIIEICNHRISQSQPRLKLKRVSNPTEIITTEQMEVEDETVIHFTPKFSTVSNNLISDPLSEDNVPHTIPVVIPAPMKSSRGPYRKKKLIKVRNHKCSKCEDKFKSEYTLKCHLIKNHKTWRCFKCKEDFTTKPQFLRHNYQLHRESIRAPGIPCTDMYGKTASVICRICEGEFAHVKSLKRHLRMKHKDHRDSKDGWSKLIKECGESEERQGNMDADTISTGAFVVIKEDIDNNGEVNPEPCDGLDDTSQFLIKSENKLPDNQPIATTGQLSSDSTSNFEIFQCTKCLKYFPAERKFQPQTKQAAHVNSICSECGKEMETSIPAKTLIFSRQDLQINCIMCTRKFATKNELDEHVKSNHKTYSSVSCPLCAKKFTSKTRMDDHMRNVHVIKISSGAEDIQKPV